MLSLVGSRMRYDRIPKAASKTTFRTRYLNRCQKCRAEMPVGTLARGALAGGVEHVASCKERVRDPQAAAAMRARWGLE